MVAEVPEGAVFVAVVLVFWEFIAKDPEGWVSVEVVFSV
jgi:hypothetical protein